MATLVALLIILTFTGISLPHVIVALAFSSVGGVVAMLVPSDNKFRYIGWGVFSCLSLLMFIGFVLGR